MNDKFIDLFCLDFNRSVFIRADSILEIRGSDVDDESILITRYRASMPLRVKGDPIEIWEAVNLGYGSLEDLYENNADRGRKIDEFEDHLVIEDYAGLFGHSVAYLLCNLKLTPSLGEARWMINSGRVKLYGKVASNDTVVTRAGIHGKDHDVIILSVDALDYHITVKRVPL